MWRIGAVSLLLILAMTRSVFAIEEPKFQVIRAFGDFEVREYAPFLVAETTVKADFENAGDEGFNRLFEYISGNNSARASITMTAPVIQTGQKIAMTAPVIQSGDSGSFTIQFTMPSNWTLQTLPIPNDKRIQLRQLPAQRFAVIRYSGFWSQKNYQANLQKLTAGMAREHLEAVGPPIWARYDPPFMPWLFRRNEILVPIAAK